MDTFKAIAGWTCKEGSFLRTVIYIILGIATICRFSYLPQILILLTALAGWILVCTLFNAYTNPADTPRKYSRPSVTAPTLSTVLSESAWPIIYFTLLLLITILSFHL